MNCQRTKTSKRWEQIGARCAQKGWPVEVALTKDESINALIRKGYEAESK